MTDTSDSRPSDRDPFPLPEEAASTRADSDEAAGSAGPVRVLQVGPGPTPVGALADALETGSSAIELRTVPDADDALATVADAPIDCVLAARTLPETDVVSFLSTLRDRAPLVPVVVLGDAWDDELVRAVVRAGGTDYMVPDDHAPEWGETLRQRVLHAVENYHTQRSRDRNRTDRRLRTARTRFETLFAHSRDAIAFTEYVNDEPIIRRLNPAFENVFGYTEAEAKGANLNELIVPEAEMDTARTLDTAALNETWIEHELRRETADGELRDFLFRGVQVTTETGVIEGYPIYTDITELKDRERRLRRQNERLDEFASIVAHDLRTPLSSAAGWLELARQDADSEYLDEIARAHDRMTELIEDLLRLAQGGETPTETAPVAVGELAEICWRHVGTAEATLEVDADTVVEANRDRLREVLENLLGNAVEHAGPAVTVTVGDLDDGRGFYVADDGPGIPPADRERVFESGVSTATDGTGMGLHIVERLVEAHGWTVTVAEGAAGGARFEVHTDGPGTPERAGED